MASKNVFRIQVLGIFYSKSHISCCVVTLQKQKCGRIVRTHFCFYNMAATLRICLSFSTKALSFRAVCILYFICSFRRESAGISNAASNIRAEFVVTGRLPFRISLSTEYPIPMLSANFLCEMPRSSNSSFKTSPG